MQILNKNQTQQVSGGVDVLGTAFTIGAVYAGYNHLGFFNTLFVCSSSGLLAGAIFPVLMGIPAAAAITAPLFAVTWGLEGSLSYPIGMLIDYLIKKE